MNNKKDKAYKVLASQEGISNGKAKSLCDRGLVSLEGKRLKIARALIDIKSKLVLQDEPKPTIIFEDDDIIAINKPTLLDVYELEKKYAPYVLLHRLDKETSGIVLMTKNDAMRVKCIIEFKKLRVYKEYVAVIHGLCSQDQTIKDKIETRKFKNKMKSSISDKGKPAITNISPISFVGKKSKIKIDITHGRTHQIRVHLASINKPIVGDDIYGIKSKSKRMMLHAKKIHILDYKLEIDEGREFEL